MKKFKLLLIGILFVSCDSNPDYQSNLAVAKKWVQAFEDGNIDLWKEAKENRIRSYFQNSKNPLTHKSRPAVAHWILDSYTPKRE